MLVHHRSAKSGSYGLICLLPVLSSRRYHASHQDGNPVHCLHKGRDRPLVYFILSDAAFSLILVVLMIAPDLQCGCSSAEAAAALYRGAEPSFNSLDVLWRDDLCGAEDFHLRCKITLDACHASEAQTMKGLAGRGTQGSLVAPCPTWAVLCRDDEEVPRRSQSSLPSRALTSDYIYSPWPRAQSLTRRQQLRRAPYKARGPHSTTRCHGGLCGMTATEGGLLYHSSRPERRSERGRKRTREARDASGTPEDGVPPSVHGTDEPVVRHDSKSLSRTRRHDRTTDASRSRSISHDIWVPSPFAVPLPPVPRQRVSSGRAASRRRSSGKTSAIDVYTASVTDLLDGYANGTFTCVQVVQEYNAQIARFNGVLRAVVYVAPRGSILRQARKCDEERRSGKVDLLAKPLHGIPIIVK